MHLKLIETLVIAVVFILVRIIIQISDRKAQSKKAKKGLKDASGQKGEKNE